MPVGSQTESGVERAVPLARPDLDVHAPSEEESGEATSEPLHQHTPDAIYPDYLSQRFAVRARRGGTFSP